MFVRWMLGYGEPSGMYKPAEENTYILSFTVEVGILWPFTRFPLKVDGVEGRREGRCGSNKVSEEVFISVGETDDQRFQLREVKDHFPQTI